jgi:hypothetical protein
LQTVVRALLVVLSAASGLMAQFPDCPSAPEGYKVFVDEVFLADSSAANPATQQLLNRLRAKLKTDFVALKATSPLPLSVVQCDGRRPTGESNFRAAVVDGLNSRNVLLEVWGSVDTADTSGADASIGFVLIPVRKAKDLSGLYNIRYTTRAAGVDGLLGLIGGAPETRAFFDIASGVKAYKERRYNEAYDCLCRAKTTVADLRGQGVGTEQAALMSYVQDLATKTVREAIADSTYQQRLRLINPDDPAQICRVNK